MTFLRIVVDTSVWIDFIAKGNDALARYLRRGRILLHPMVIGEVALGSLARRTAVLEQLDKLPKAPVASHSNVLAMIERQSLFSRGIGYVDSHLIASARLLDGGRVWTRDKRLAEQAERLSVAFNP